MKAFVCVCVCVCVCVSVLSQNDKMIADRQFRDNTQVFLCLRKKMFSNALFVLELLKINTFMLTKKRND